MSAAPGTGADAPEAQEYAGELGGFVLARSAVDRVSARRGDTDWLAAAWADPQTRILVLDNARALVRFGDKEAELILVPPAEAPEGLRFLLGVDDAEAAYFGVMGRPGCLESLEARIALGGDGRPGSTRAGSTRAGSTRGGSTRAGSTRAGSTRAGSTRAERGGSPARTAERGCPRPWSGTRRDSRRGRPVPGRPGPEVPAAEVPAPRAPAPEAPAGKLPAAEAAAAPDVPAPDVPAPDVPAPDVPAPDVPAPDVPAPDVPAPDVPAPDVPAPDVPAPDAPRS